MTNLTPSIAAQLAVSSYDIRKGGASVEEVFFRLRDDFDFSPSSRFKGASGGAFLMKESGFGVVAKGKGVYANDALVVVRGTASGWDLLTDLHAGRASPFQGKIVHSGFYKTYSSLNIESLFRQQLGGSNPKTVHCVGHSLGGAVATLVADWAKRRSIDAKLYTFGCPRVGQRGFAEHLSLQLKPENIFRVYHSSDVVPMVPVWPFVHAPELSKSCYIKFFTLNPYKAHSSRTYLGHAEKVNTFEDLRKSPPTVNWESEAKAWLRNACNRGILLNAHTYTLISHSLTYLMKKTLTVTTLGLQEAGGSVSDYLDRLAMYLHVGAKADKEIENDVRGLMDKMLAAVGIMPGGAQSLTMHFIRWVFTLFTNALYSMVRMALRAERAA